MRHDPDYDFLLLGKNEKKKISVFPIDFYANFDFFDIFGKNSDI